MKCPMFITVRCKDGETLEITNIVHEYNHEVSNAAFNHLFHQRRLDSGQTNEIESVLKFKPNKRILQDYIHKTTWKVVILKYIHNMASSSKGADEANLQALLKEMKKVQGAVVEVIADENGLVNEKFPELFMIDATYKLNELRLPLFIIMNVDGNGASEIVALWIVSDEGRHTVTEMIKMFKWCNENWSKIRCIMSKTLVNIISGIPLLICLFHVLKAFRRDVTTEKLGIIPDERLLALEILQKPAYAKSENAYFEIYEELKQTNLESVIRFFNDNWHPIRSEWVEGMQSYAHNYLNRTNNRVKSINQKLKKVILNFQISLLSLGI